MGSRGSPSFLQVQYPDNLNPFDSSSDDEYDESKNPFHSTDEDECEKRDVFPDIKVTPVPAPRRRLLESLKRSETIHSPSAPGTDIRNGTHKSLRERIASRPVTYSEVESADKSHTDSDSVSSIKSTGSVKRRAPAPPPGKPPLDHGPVSEKHNTANKSPISRKPAPAVPNGTLFPLAQKDVRNGALHSNGASNSDSVSTKTNNGTSASAKFTSGIQPVSALKTALRPDKSNSKRKSLTSEEEHKMTLEDVAKRMSILAAYSKRLDEESVYLSFRARQIFADARIPLEQADPDGEMMTRLKRLLEAKENIEDQKRQMCFLRNLRTLELEHQMLQHKLSSFTAFPLHSNLVDHESLENKLMRRLFRNVKKREALLQDEENQRSRKTERRNG